MAEAMPALREWIGAVAEWPAVATLDDGASLTACYYVGGVELLQTKAQKPYLKLQLHDRGGAVDGRVWDDAERHAERVEVGCFVGVRGRVQIFRGSHQLKIDELARVRVSPEELGLFLPRSRRDADSMERELQALIGSVEDPALGALLRRMLDRDSELGAAYRQAPAAKMHHHACVGGLLEHSLSVTSICDFLARHYGDDVDRDLLVTGALLHDIGKTREIAVQAGFPYTDEGKLLGHILIGLRLIADAAGGVKELSEERLLLLQHLVASHQGKYEWQSPREPRLLEALLLHHADDLDAKFFQAEALVAGVADGWTSYDRSFARDFLSHRGRADDERLAPEEPDGAEDAADPAEPPPSAQRVRPAEQRKPKDRAQPAEGTPGPERPTAADATLGLFD